MQIFKCWWWRFGRKTSELQQQQKIASYLCKSLISPKCLLFKPNPRLYMIFTGYLRNLHANSGYSYNNFQDVCEMNIRNVEICNLNIHSSTFCGKPDKLGGKSEKKTKTKGPNHVLLDLLWSLDNFGQFWSGLVWSSLVWSGLSTVYC